MHSIHLKKKEQFLHYPIHVGILWDSENPFPISNLYFMAINLDKEMMIIVEAFTFAHYFFLLIYYIT